MKESRANPDLLLKGDEPDRRVYKMVLTGGPCGGKTTGQAKLASFFESIGWKVFRVPETATVLMSGGIAFGELNEDQVLDFQEHLVKTMMALEDTYITLAEKSEQNCLIICDRGVMDASAFINQSQWERLLSKLNLCEEDVCEKRYDQIVHMMSAANGAEDFYTVEEHAARFEGLELARERDRRAMSAWSEHPYRDVVDNRVDFELKIKHLLDLVVKRIGLNTIGDRLKAASRKIKFFVKGPLPPDHVFPTFTDFEVIHHYLRTNRKDIQSRLRRRGRSGRWTYTCTVRRPEKMGQVVEVKTPLNKRDYENMLNYADSRHLPVFKTRRCFLYNNQQYQLDIYREPCHSRCRGLMLLETFTTMPNSLVQSRLPPFLNISSDVTGDPAFSMFNLALKSEWLESTEHFCHKLVSADDEELGVGGGYSHHHRHSFDVLQALNRLADCISDQSSTAEEESTTSSDSD